MRTLVLLFSGVNNVDRGSYARSPSIFNSAIHAEFLIRKHANQVEFLFYKSPEWVPYLIIMPTDKSIDNNIDTMTTSSLNNLPFVGVNDKIKVLLLNPNSTEIMTINCLKMAKEHLAPDVTVYGFTASKPAPTTIECHLDGVLSAAAAFRDAYDYIGQVDAVLVACFSDHPLTNCIREEFDIPVCGIFEASIYTARLLGGKFGILTTVQRSSIRHGHAVKAMGLDGFCAGLLSTNLKVAELHTKPREEVLALLADRATKLVEQGADTLILGCAGMSDMQQAVTEAVQDKGVQVIDGVVSGLNLLTGVVRSGLKTSSFGLFCSSKESRETRGQEYL